MGGFKIKMFLQFWQWENSKEEYPCIWLVRKASLLTHFMAESRRMKEHETKEGKEREKETLNSPSVCSPLLR